MPSPLPHQPLPLNRWRRQGSQRFGLHPAACLTRPPPPLPCTLTSLRLAAGPALFLLLVNLSLCCHAVSGGGGLVAHLLARRMFLLGPSNTLTSPCCSSSGLSGRLRCLLRCQPQVRGRHADQWKVAIVLKGSRSAKLYRPWLLFWSRRSFTFDDLLCQIEQPKCLDKSIWYMHTQRLVKASILKSAVMMVVRVNFRTECLDLQAPLTHVNLHKISDTHG